MNPLPHCSTVRRPSCALPAALALAAALAMTSTLIAAEAGTTAPPAANSVPTKTPARHPLKGVVLDIRADRGALVVKHEEVPGVMRAMTMLLKVDAPTLAAAKKDQAIIGLLVRKPDGWWLEEVKPAN